MTAPLYRDDLPHATWPVKRDQPLRQHAAAVRLNGLLAHHPDECQWPLGTRVASIGCHNCPDDKLCAERRACQFRRAA